MLLSIQHTIMESSHSARL